MFPTDIRLRGTELTFMSFLEQSGAHLDAVGVHTRSADQVSGCDQDFAAVSALGPGSQYPHRVTHPDIMCCRLRGSLGSHGMLLLKLLANLPRHGFLPLEELIGIHCHALS